MAARSGGNGDQGGMKCSLLPRDFVSHSRSFAGHTLKLWLVDFSKPPNQILRRIVTPKRMKLSQKSSVPQIANLVPQALPPDRPVASIRSDIALGVTLLAQNKSSHTETVLAINQLIVLGVRHLLYQKHPEPPDRAIV